MEEKRDTALYTVGEVSQMMKVSRKTLFYYDRKKLLLPSARAGIQNHKLYSSGDIGRLKEIIRYRQAGLHIEEIRSLLDGPAGGRTGVLETALGRAVKEKEECEKQIILLTSLIEENR